MTDAERSNADAGGRFLNRAIELSLVDVEASFGRPFGAVVVHEGVIIGEGFNTTARANDPTAHAEVNAIRAACVRYAAPVLPPTSRLYSSAEPCPMCYSASFWAGISEIFFAISSEEAARYGFEDRELQSRLAEGGPRGMQMRSGNLEQAHDAFRRFRDSHPDG